MNALSHGVFAESLVLRNESREAFDQLRTHYYSEFQPEGILESEMVDQLIQSVWRQRRLWNIERSLIDTRIEAMRPAVDAEYKHVDHAARTSMAYTELADRSNALACAHRQEARMRRAFHRALAELRASKMKNEPGPDPACSSVGGLNPRPSAGLQAVRRAA
jgi:hypothetical protein